MVHACLLVVKAANKASRRRTGLPATWGSTLGSQMRAEAGIIHVLGELVDEGFGDEAIRILSDVYAGMAEGVVDGMKHFGIEGNDARRFAYYWKAADEIMFDTPIETVEASLQKTVVRIPKCPSPAETNPRLCSAHFCAAGLSPTLTAARARP